MLEKKATIIPYQFTGSGGSVAEVPAEGAAITGRGMSLTPGCSRHAETMQALQKEKEYEIYLPSNPATDNVVVNADGSITRIAATPSINGMQWPIPAEQMVKVPQSIYEQVKMAYYQPEMLASEQQAQTRNNYCLYSR